MAVMNFGGVDENVVTREEFPLEKAREVLKDEVIAVIGYGVQGPGQSLHLRDNGFNVSVGQRPGKTHDKALDDGWETGETLFRLGCCVQCMPAHHIIIRHHIVCFFHPFNKSFTNNIHPTIALFG